MSPEFWLTPLVVVATPAIAATYVALAARLAVEERWR